MSQPSSIENNSENLPLSTSVPKDLDTFELLIPPSFDQGIFNSLGDAVVVVDRDATIVRVNLAALKLTGYAESELLGRPVARLTANKRLVSKLFKKAFGDGVSGRFETTCIDKTGHWFPISVSVSKIFEPVSSTDKLVLVARDVSRRKRLETESQVISRIIRGVASTANLDELLGLIHRSIRRVVPAENFFVALYDPETELLTMQFFVDK